MVNLDYMWYALYLLCSISLKRKKDGYDTELKLQWVKALSLTVV